MEEINKDIVEKIINVAVCHDYPVLLGKAMASFIEREVKFELETFKKFYMYLDSVKKLRPDAIRFI